MKPENIKYRVCKNDYGWYKIQEQYKYKKVKNFWCHIIEDLLLLILILLFPIVILICTIDEILNTRWLFNMENKIESYTKEELVGWKDEFNQETFKTKKEAESEIEQMIKENTEHKERFDNSWKCEGDVY